MNSINYPKTVIQQQKKISAPPPLVVGPQHLQQQPTTKQTNYLKPPPPLYHNTKLLVNQKVNNHSVSFFTTTASSQNLKTLNNHQQKQPSQQIRTVAQKPVYEHITGSYPQSLPPPLAPPPLKIKCEPLKLADDCSNDKFIATSNSCSSSSNGSAFTVPRAAAAKKIVQCKFEILIGETHFYNFCFLFVQPKHFQLDLEQKGHTVRHLIMKHFSEYHHVCQILQ